RERPRLTSCLSKAGWIARSRDVLKVDCYDSVEGSIYNYGALTIDGEEYIPFQKYKGKMILFVNVATY
uniref:Glutathione peroxidase 3 n=1 Tax=Pelusios castaneus TaxID=367368 RepID=A0A8C8VQE9_9SAUR